MERKSKLLLAIGVFAVLAVAVYAQDKYSASENFGEILAGRPGDSGGLNRLEANAVQRERGWAYCKLCAVLMRLA